MPIPMDLLKYKKLYLYFIILANISSLTFLTICCDFITTNFVLAHQLFFLTIIKASFSINTE